MHYTKGLRSPVLNAKRDDIYERWWARQDSNLVKSDEAACSGLLSRTYLNWTVLAGHKNLATID